MDYQEIFTKLAEINDSELSFDHLFDCTDSENAISFVRELKFGFEQAITISKNGSEFDWLPFETRVYRAGVLIIDSNYTKIIGAEPGDEFEIRINNDRSISMIRIDEDQIDLEGEIEDLTDYIQCNFEKWRHIEKSCIQSVAACSACIEIIDLFCKPGERMNRILAKLYYVRSYMSGFGLSLWDKAVKDLELGTLLEPDNIYIYRLLGQALLENRQYKQSADTYYKTMEEEENLNFDPSFCSEMQMELYSTVINYCKALLFNGEAEESNQFLERASTYENFEAYRYGFLVTHAELLVIQKQFDASIEKLEKAKSINSNLTYAWNAQVNIHMLRGQYIQAIELCKCAIQACEGESNIDDIYLNMHDCHLALNDYNEAIQSLSKAIYFKASRPDYYYLRASLHQKRSDMQNCMEDLIKAAKLGDPSASKVIVDFFDYYNEQVSSMSKTLESRTSSLAQGSSVEIQRPSTYRTYRKRSSAYRNLGSGIKESIGDESSKEFSKEEIDHQKETSTSSTQTTTNKDDSPSWGSILGGLLVGAAGAALYSWATNDKQETHYHLNQINLYKDDDDILDYCHRLDRITGSSYTNYLPDMPGGYLPDGRQTYIGPQGGRYYLSDNGRKVYVDR